MNARRIPRRTLLRGVIGSSAVALALPPLEAMLRRAPLAVAQAELMPKLFGVWFFGDGVRPEHWVPDLQGAGWQPKSELEPLLQRGVIDYVSVASGLEAKGNPYVHAGPASAVLTGTGLVHPEGDSGTPQGPSIDSLVAKEIGSSTPFKSLETGVYTFLGNGSAYTAISHRGPDAPNNPENDARILYNRLFGAGSPGRLRGGDAAQPADNTIDNRKSALDAVLSDCASLSARLGQADRLRLEQHCDAVRAIERRLETASQPSSTLCEAVATPVNITDEKAGFNLYYGSEHYDEVNKTLSALLAHALACDLTRVFSHCYTNPASHWQTVVNGEKRSFHVMTHEEPGDQPIVHQGVVRTIGNLAETLAIFRDTPFGAGNLLDQMGLLVTSDCSLGKTHSATDYPILIVGKAGGSLRAGEHYRSGSAESVTKAGLTVARAVGAQLASFGTENQSVTDGLTELSIAG